MSPKKSIFVWIVLALIGYSVVQTVMVIGLLFSSLSSGQIDESPTVILFLIALMMLRAFIGVTFFVNLFNMSRKALFWVHLNGILGAISYYDTPFIAAIILIIWIAFSIHLYKEIE